MFICLIQLYNNTIYDWNSEKSRLKFAEKGNLIVSTDEISTIEPEKTVISRVCIEKMPDKFKAKYKDESPIISKITLRNGRVFLVEESPQEIRNMLSEKSDKKWTKGY